MDKQTLEIIGRNRLVNELLIAGLEVAIPSRDRGIDLIAYRDLKIDTPTFMAIPIQMKAASKSSFSIDKKYAKISNLVLAYVWGVNGTDESVTYGLTHEESVEIGDAMGWTQEKSWTKDEYGRFSSSSPNTKLIELLEPFRMTSEKWLNHVRRHRDKKS
jgi:hypothetical protein